MYKGGVSKEEFMAFLREELVSAVQMHKILCS
jgi:hypothetical protein